MCTSGGNPRQKAGGTLSGTCRDRRWRGGGQNGPVLYLCGSGYGFASIFKRFFLSAAGPAWEPFPGRSAFAFTRNGSVRFGSSRRGVSFAVRGAKRKSAPFLFRTEKSRSEFPNGWDTLIVPPDKGQFWQENHCRPAIGPELHRLGKIQAENPHDGFGVNHVGSRQELHLKVHVVADTDEFLGIHHVVKFHFGCIHRYRPFLVGVAEE